MKSKRSRLLTVAKRRLADASLDQPAFTVDQLQFRETQQITRVIRTLAMPVLNRHRVVVALKAHQRERAHARELLGAGIVHTRRRWQERRDAATPRAKRWPMVSVS